MKKLFVLSALIFAGVFILSFRNEQSSPSHQPNDSLQLDRAKHLAILTGQIKGKEKLPVDSVFQNLKVLGGFPAENLLLAMEK
jgi:hypothetical protein